MIIAIMTIVVMAVVGLVACVDNNGGSTDNGGGTTDNGGGSTDNGGGNTDNGGGGTEEVTPITETAGLNINNIHTELEKKNFTLKNELMVKYDGVTETQVRILEYEPVKFKETLFYNDENYSRYFYKLGDKNVIVEMDLSVSFTSDIAISRLVDVIVPNVDLYVLKDGVYTVKKNKFEDFYKAMYHDNEIPTGDVWESYSSFLASIKIQFKEDSILISYAMSSNESYILEITKIGSTSVTIPQEILDLPLPGDETTTEEAITETAGLNINNFNTELKKKNFTLKCEFTEKNNGVTKTEIRTLEYEPTKWKETAVIDGDTSVSYLYRHGDKNILVDADSNTSFVENILNSTLNEALTIVPNAGNLFELTDGVYTVKKDKYWDFYKAATGEDAKTDDQNWCIFYSSVIASIKIQFKANSIALSYSAFTSSDSGLSYSFEITKIGSTSVTIPQEILDLPLPDSNV